MDLALGEAAAGFKPLDLPAGEEISASALAVDGSYLAMVSGEGQACQAYAGGSACYPEANHLHLVNMADWEMTSVPLAGGGSVVRLAFTPDGSRLALAYDAVGKSTLVVYETAGASEIARVELDYQPGMLAYVLGGRSLVAFGSPLGDQPGITRPDEPRLELFASQDLQPQSAWALEGILSGDWCVENCSAEHGERSSVLWQPGLTLSPDGSRVYIVHADDERLSTIDLANSAIDEGAITKKASLLEQILSLGVGVAYAKGPLNGAMKRAVVSPDGSRLFVNVNRFQVGPQGVEEERLLQVIDLPSGELLASRELPLNGYMHSLKPSQDGEQLFMLGYTRKRPWVEAVSSGSLEPQAKLLGWEITPAAGTLLGKREVPAGNELAVIDPATLEVLRTWKMDGEAHWLASP
jgi:hypothetical protein